MGELDLEDGAVLEQDRPYLIPLNERLSLPAGIRGRTNPRSSTGRPGWDRAGRIDLLLDGGICPGGVPSTVVDCTQAQLTILRQGALSEESIFSLLNSK